MSPDARRLEIKPCPPAAVARVRAALGVSDAVAQILVRRGLDEPAAARTWLAADVRHDASAFGGMDAAVALVRRHLAARSRITVHGDYDVDGVCSTAILVRALRSLAPGADGGPAVDWYLPSRLEDGYGLSARTVERLAARGTQLLITADCAITAVSEVAAARAAGMDVLVTDHHAPRADGALPDAPIVHPGLGGYPCPELCAAGVALKLAEALGAPTAAEDLDLVALATVADVVALRGENRRLVREGLRALAATRKPGLRALMAVAQVEPSRLDATAVGFRLAPRINAAGRLAHADAGLELVLTGDEERAKAIAEELDRCNAERRHVEQRMLFEAEAQARTQDGAHGIVVAAEGWHPGVAGIVASRLAERHHRPTVVIALDGASGTGSGRSIPAFDLLGALDACSDRLARHGGHRAAAGLEIAAGDVEAFRAAFDAHAAAVLTAEDLVPVQHVDAIVSGGDLGIELAEELERLAPFGHGNPAPKLLVPAARLADPRPMGEGKHLRLSLEAGGVRCRAVAFGTSRLAVDGDEAADAVVALELDDFRGTVEPRLVVRHAQPSAPGPVDVVGEPADWLDCALAELDAPLAMVARDVAASGPCAEGVVDRRDRGVAGTVAGLVASGESVLVVCADCSRRAAGLRGRLGGFALADWAALTRDATVAERFDHVVAIDPPADPALLRYATVLAWGAAETRFARDAHARDHALRDELAVLYRTLRAAAPLDASALEAALRGDGAHPRSPRLAGRLVRVLSELGLVALDPVTRTMEVPVAERTELERSVAFRALNLREDGQRSRPAEPRNPPAAPSHRAAEAA